MVFTQKKEAGDISCKIESNEGAKIPVLGACFL
jgi:hypothetical protein